ncbi:hypothetical protein EW026_g4243 [Hermanssonia centrifuga]|uniref:Uncharacterized protein n=1 Tax=Hermanssonia centrifuga TaxID=98765 RepID=A0A4S4KIM6_9APHY|nr:hypothetical protein EW026_g4243 [Hermanssonia centrifuga]
MLQHHLTFHGKWTDKIEDSYPRHFRLQLRAEVESKASMDRESEYIALSAENEYSSDLSALAIRGSYTNNPHVLVKIECSRNSPIAITTSYDGVSDDVGFTITAYSPLPISWIEESQQSPYSDKIKGAFTISLTSISGQVHEKSGSEIMYGGQRITEIVHSDIAATSGPYSYGHARVAKDLPGLDDHLASSQNF